MTIVRITFILIWLALAGSVNARPYDDIIESGKIVIAVYENFPPYSFMQGGEPAGVDVDIAKEIAKAFDVELELLWMTSGETTEDDLRNYLWKGHIIHKFKADLMMRAPYDREYSLKRDDVGLLVHELVHMFAPYHSESWQIVHNTERLPDVPTMSMFQYHKIGVENDTVPFFYLTGAFNGRFREKTINYVNIQDAVSAMQAGDVDAVMGMRTQVSWVHSKLVTKNYKLAKNAFPLIGKQKWDIGIAVHNHYRALSYAAGDVITELLLEGKMQKIFDKYDAILEIPEYYGLE